MNPIVVQDTNWTRYLKTVPVSKHIRDIYMKRLQYFCLRRIFSLRMNNTLFITLFFSSACDIGYYGLNCEDECPPPYYGHNCKSKCNCSEISCHHVYGCEIYQQGMFLLLISSALISTHDNHLLYIM